MYLHIGSGRYIRKKRIIGIFDMDTATVCASTREFLVKKQKKGLVNAPDEDIPKSFLLLDGEEGESRVLLSKLSSGVLCDRTAKGREIE